MPGLDTAQGYFILMAGRRFAYNELGEDNPVVVDEDEIRRTYWDYWTEQMTKVGKADKINWADCLDDFQVVNWAWEINENPDMHGV